MTITTNKVLFIDRDGTLVVEPPDDYQLDHFEKLAFYPKAIQNMVKINSLDYQLIMVTNQDGLGTASFPKETFWPIHQLILSVLASEGVYFDEVHIDKSFPEEKSPTRKPQTGMLKTYIDNPLYDMANSYVIGDRITDVELAKNLGCRAIFINNQEINNKELQDVVSLQTTDWDEIYRWLRLENRQISVNRKTNETDIRLSLDLDGNGKADIETGLHFFDHMLEQIARHGQIDISLHCKGDLKVDEHHTIEDTAITLGEAFDKALGSKLGIDRYGFYLPMDEALAQVAIDFGGRSQLVWQADFTREKIGDVPTEMFEHFFKSFCDSARANLNIRVEGKNEHHKIEAIFKAFAKAIKSAIRQDVDKMVLPSTKGKL